MPNAGGKVVQSGGADQERARRMTQKFCAGRRVTPSVAINRPCHHKMLTFVIILSGLSTKRRYFLRLRDENGRAAAIVLVEVCAFARRCGLWRGRRLRRRRFRRRNRRDPRQRDALRPCTWGRGGRWCTLRYRVDPDFVHLFRLVAALGVLRVRWGLRSGGFRSRRLR